MNIALTSLWLPILFSAIAVFIVSSLIWAVIQYHNSDWQKLPDEESARSALKGAAAGQYSLPHATDNKAKQDKDWQKKYQDGPVAMLVVVPHGSMAMGKQMIQWFVYCLVISVCVAYIAGVTLMPGAEYLKVFQVTSTVAFLSYAGAHGLGFIWFGHTTTRFLKDLFDGLIYGLLTGGFFGWLWP